MRRLVLAGILVAIFGCSHTETRTRPETRMVENDGACPTIENAERDAWHRIDMPWLCWYRMHPPTIEGLAATDCDKPEWKRHTLDVLREQERGRWVPDESGNVPEDEGSFLCDKEGLVYVNSQPSSCVAELTDEDGVTSELLAGDAFTPYRWCSYEVEYEAETGVSCSGRAGSMSSGEMF